MRDDENGKLIVENGDLSLKTLKQVYETGYKDSLAQQKRKQIVASRLKQIRKQHNITQKELCDKIGIMIATYSGYETGKQAIPLDTIVRICELLSISADYLLGMTNNPKGRFTEVKQEVTESKESSIEERIAQLDKMMKELREEVSQK